MDKLKMSVMGYIAALVVTVFAGATGYLVVAHPDPETTKFLAQTMGTVGFGGVLVYFFRGGPNGGSN